MIPDGILRRNTLRADKRALCFLERRARLFYMWQSGYKLPHNLLTEKPHIKSLKRTVSYFENRDLVF